MVVGEPRHRYNGAQQDARSLVRAHLPGAGRKLLRLHHGRPVGAALIGLERGAVVLSLCLLGAHFLRAGAVLPALVAVALVTLLFVRRPGAARVLQAVLVLGSLEWVRTLVVQAGRRAEIGEPAARMVAILGTVAAVSLWAAIALSGRRLGRFHGLRAVDGENADS